MVTATSFWKRVGGAFRANGNGHHAHNEPEFPEEPAPITPPPSNGNGLLNNGRGARAGFWDWFRRGTGLEDARIQRERMNGVLDELHDQLRRHDHRSATVTAAIDRVADTLDRLACGQQTNNEHMLELTDLAQRAETRGAHLSATIEEMPASMQAQAEAIRSVATQMRHTHQSDQALTQTLHHLGQTVESLRLASTMQLDTMQRRHDTDVQQAEALRTLLREQQQRFLFVTLAAVVSMGAISAGLVTLAYLLGA